MAAQQQKHQDKYLIPTDHSWLEFTPKSARRHGHGMRALGIVSMLISMFMSGYGIFEFLTWIIPSMNIYWIVAKIITGALLACYSLALVRHAIHKSSDMRIQAAGGLNAPASAYRFRIRDYANMVHNTAFSVCALYDYLTNIYAMILFAVSFSVFALGWEKVSLLIIVAFVLAGLLFFFSAFGTVIADQYYHYSDHWQRVEEKNMQRNASGPNTSGNTNNNNNNNNSNASRPANADQKK